MSDHIEPEVFEEILDKTNNYMQKEQRIARKALVSLVKSGHATFLFLADDEIRDYWAKLASTAAQTIAKRREAWAKYEIKKAAWDRLTEEDRKILKIRKPTAPRG